MNSQAGALAAAVKSRRRWQELLRRRRRSEPLAPVVATDTPAEADGAAIAIAPNDPIIAYFGAHPSVVEVEKLHLDSPAVAAMRGAGVKLAVPLVSQGELIGLLTLGPRLSEQEYSADDRRLLDDLAAHAAPAVRVAQLVRQQRLEAQAREAIEQELRIAHLIQQTLLPRELPQTPGWHVAVHYRPARAVGGDFYDFIELDDGRIGVVVGDASDKGVPAALMMATARTMLRASGQRLESPAEVLARVNEVLCQDTPPTMFVTCLYAVLDPASGHLRFANAGHCLPYLQRAGEAVELRARGWPLGLMPGVAYDEHEATVGPGGCLLFYSDGLIEAHNAAREMFGTPRLAAMLREQEGGPGLLDALLTELHRFTGPDYEQEDDTTLLMMRRSPHTPADEGSEVEVGGEGWPAMLAEFAVASEPGNERLVVERVTAAADGLGLPPARLERLKTAVAETTMNAIEHGNQNRPELPVAISVLASPTAVTVRVADRGGGRAMPEAEVPDLDAKLAGLQSPRGWGLFLIKQMVDGMRTISTEDGHTVELSFDREGGGDGRDGA